MNENNTVLQASLINLSSLIQKILDQNRTNIEKNKEKNSTDNINSSIPNLKEKIPNLKENSNPFNKINKGIEVNKKIISLKKNVSNNRLNMSPGHTVNERNYVSSSHVNTLANIQNSMTNINFQNYLGNVTEKSNFSQYSVTQDQRSNKSNAQIEYIKDLSRNKDKIKNDLNNKSLNHYEYRKNSFNIFENKSEKSKTFKNKKKKEDITLNKVKSNKTAQNRNNFKKRMTHKQFLNHISSQEESSVKEGIKDSFIKKNSKIQKIKTNNNSNNFTKNNLRQSYQKFFNNSRNNNLMKNKSKSKKKSLTYHSTTSDLENKNQENNKNENKEKLIKNMSNREKSYYALSNSPILRLNERLLFGRSTANLRNIQKVSDILSKNEIFLNDKLKELNEKIKICDNRIKTSFNPSKTAEINFNFILSKDEEEFKNFSIFAENEKEKNEYFIFLKIIYLLFNEKFENIESKNLSTKLYNLITNKGFKTIKDYLYSLFFKRKDTSNIIFNIPKFNNLVDELKLDKKFNIKFCRFALFTSFVIREIIIYGNDIKSMLELKVRTQELIDVINKKLKIYKAAYSLKKK